eukprot:37943-Eustigmatos_ZCMA.PRE.1
MASDTLPLDRSAPAQATGSCTPRCAYSVVCAVLDQVEYPCLQQMAEVARATKLARLAASSRSATAAGVDQN